MIKFAVIGLGHIGKRHAEMIRRNKDSELVAVCDILTPEELGIEPDVPFFSSIDDLLNSDIEIDVVNICTPNGYHTEHAIKALEKKHHIVIEKPLALKKSDAERIVFKSIEVSKSVFCVTQNRYSPPSVNCYWNRDERYYKAGNWHGTQDLDGGTLFTQFSHFIDIMYWLFGDITNIRGNFHDFSHQTLTDFEDSGVVTFDFINGGMGCLNYSTSVWDKNLESSIIIVGEKGTVKAGGEAVNIIEEWKFSDYFGDEEIIKQECSENPPNVYGFALESRRSFWRMGSGDSETSRERSFLNLSMTRLNCVRSSYLYTQATAIPFTIPTVRYPLLMTTSMITVFMRMVRSV